MSNPRSTPSSSSSPLASTATARPSSPVEEIFPTQLPAEISTLEDYDSLSALEKIFVCATSKKPFHRSFISHALPQLLKHVPPKDAVTYILPLLTTLAMDQDDAVKDALATQLASIIWWFFTKCDLTSEEALLLPSEDDLSTSPNIPMEQEHAPIPVSSFTPILGTLLLSPNATIGAKARQVVVELLNRLQHATVCTGLIEDDEFDQGLLNDDSKAMVENEILQNIILGMGRLYDDDEELDEDEFVSAVDDIQDGGMLVDQPEVFNSNRHSPKLKGNTINPYFPVLPTDLPPASSNEPVKSPRHSPQQNLVRSSKALPSSPLALPPITADVPAIAVSSSGTTKADPIVVNGGEMPSPKPMLPEYKTGRGSPTPRTASPTTLIPPRSPSLAASTLSPPATSYRYMFERKREPVEVPSGSPRLEQPGLEEEGVMEEDECLVEDDSHLQAAVGRLSSMSLIAAVAVSGVLSEDTKRSFVSEVERVGRDEVHWVRREASFALGALAKVVSDEMVVDSLLPLFQSLCQDPVSHVRHSAVFALPGILSRLSERERRRLSLDVVLRLSQDPDRDVRSGVLEALGEVISTFQGHKEGPPETLVYIFLGNQAHDRHAQNSRSQANPPLSSPSSGANIRDQGGGSSGGPLVLMAVNSEQEAADSADLIRAFNYPAVTLTLGRGRWKGELRRVYLDLCRNRSTKVRRTLAASLGEMAKMIGPDHARADLVEVWWDAVRCEEEQVRIKVVESLETFLTALDSRTRVELVRGVLNVWNEGGWKGWREREGLAGTFLALSTLVDANDSDVIRGLLNAALQDPVAAVREAAIRAIPAVWTLLSQKASALTALREDLHLLAQSGLFRRRMTFVGCLHSLMSHRPSLISLADDLFRHMPALADDSLLSVRIGVARLVGSLYTDVGLDPSSVPSSIRDVRRRLSIDPAPDVRSFVDFVTTTAKMDLSVLQRPPLTEDPSEPHVWTFSRPPPATMATS